MGNFEILDHTADLALKITGDNPVDFFKQALYGLIALTEIDQAESSQDEVISEIHISGNDLEEILVRFLNELVRLIQESELAPYALRNPEVFQEKFICEVLSRPIRRYPDGYVEIKAATYHMLKIENCAGVLSATIILDI